MNGTAGNDTSGGGGGGRMSMELGVRAAWDSLFVTMIVVAIAGNLIVLWIILGIAPVQMLF